MIIRTFNELKIFLDNFNPKVFTLDVETDNDKLGMIQLCDGANSCAILRPTTSMIALLREHLIHKGNTIVGHNLIFDLQVLSQVGLDFNELDWYDTMIAAHLINENKDYPKGLKALINKFFPDRKTMDYEQAISFGFESEKFMEYAENDVIFTYDLMRLQIPELQKQGLKDLFVNIEMPFLRAMLEMHKNGIQVDLEKARAITKDLKESLFALKVEMCEFLEVKYHIQKSLFGNDLLLVTSVDFDSPLQVRDILTKKLGLELTDKTKSGALSVSKVVIEKYKFSNPFVAMLDRYRIASKLLSAFFTPLPLMVVNGRVYPRFNGIGTVTGRLSCSQPNIQQLPKINKNFPVDTRSCFVAPEGKKLIGLDYNQQELRIIAHLSKDERLINILTNDGDLHLINANLVFNLGIPEEKLYKNHPEYEEIKEKYNNDRDKGKIFSFGIAYGMGAHKLSRDFKVDMDVAEQLLDNFFKGFPRLKHSIDECHEIANKKLEVVSLTGRKRRFEMNQWGKADPKALRQSFNFLIQSLGADIMRLACIKAMQYKQDNPDKGIKLIMTIHDELILEVNEVHAEEVKEDIRKLMESVMNLDVPLKVGGKVADTYGNLK